MIDNIQRLERLDRYLNRLRFAGFDGGTNVEAYKLLCWAADELRKHIRERPNVALVVPIDRNKARLPADEVLAHAIDKLEDVVIVGYDKQGNEYIASSMPDGAEANWLLCRAQ